MAITGYHSNKFPARVEGAEKLEYNIDDPLVGIEFECEIDNRDSAIEQVEREFKEGTRFFAERDGSLDQNHGVEFVSTPMKMKEVMSKDGPLAKLTEIVADHGERTDKATVGMHVNVSAVSAEHAWATAVLGNALRDYSRRIGGRHDAYSKHTFEVRDSYGKESAVAVRYRKTKGTVWECPTTGLRIADGDAPVEYRNEFRNHRSQAHSLRARTQVYYSVAVSRFAHDNLDAFLGLKKLHVNSRPAALLNLIKQFMEHLANVSKTNKWAERALTAMNSGIENVTLEKRKVA